MARDTTRSARQTPHREQDACVLLSHTCAALTFIPLPLRASRQRPIHRDTRLCRGKFARPRVPALRYTIRWDKGKRTGLPFRCLDLPPRAQGL